MSTLETNLVQPSTGTTLTLGASGDTIDVPSGATLDATGATITGALTNTPAFRAYMDATQTISDASGTKLNFNTESYDTGSNYDTSNYRFTPTIAGKYLITASVRLSGSVTATNCQLYIYKNGSVYNRSTQGFNGDSSPMITNTDTVEMNGSSDYIEIYFYHNVGSNLDISGSVANTYFNGLRIIGA